MHKAGDFALTGFCFQWPAGLHRPPHNSPNFGHDFTSGLRSTPDVAGPSCCEIRPRVLSL
jgi:hypothetical protein